MDLTRLGDKKYLSEMAAESKKRNADPIYVGERTNYLESLLPVIGKQLRDTATWQMPQDINLNESVAICLALNIREAFTNHTAQFLSVQPWVLKKWRMEHFIGQRIGSID
jgi:hypothetical protein